MRPTRNSDKALLGLRLHREGLKTSTGSVVCSGPGSRQKSGGGGRGGEAIWSLKRDEGSGGPVGWATGTA